MAAPDFNIWYKSYTESFLYINERSNIKNDWLDYSRVLSGPYGNSIIKPINLYMEKMSQPPKLLSIENNFVTLQQQTFAEIMLLKRKNQTRLSAMEKIHMRQFYYGALNTKNDVDCFNEIFRFAMPWIVDVPNLRISITNSENSPFTVFDTEINSIETAEIKRIDPEMIFFKFKKIGRHMVDEEYGKIKLFSPMFNMSFHADDIMIDRIKEFYVNN